MKLSSSHLKGKLGETLSESAQRHSTFLTIFAVVAILVAGVGLADGRAYWWISALAIAFAFLLFFLFINARVFIKATVAILVTLFTANAALQAGVMVSPFTALGLTWMAAQIFLFFLCVAMSYVFGGYRSRWTAATYALPLALLSGIVYVAFMPPAVALTITVATGVFFFMGYYKVLGFLSTHSSLMPTNQAGPKIQEAIVAASEDEGWQTRELSSKSLWRRQTTVDYLVWNEEHAYVLHPVDLKSKFGISASKKATKLMHQGYSINNWLLRLVHKRIPLWRSRNASIMLVLLDVDNTNGKKSEAIGVALPDSAKRVPVGIYPGKALLAGSAAGFLEDIDSHYGSYLTPLTPKQKIAMDEIGRDGHSEYLEEPADSLSGA